MKPPVEDLTVADSCIVSPTTILGPFGATVMLDAVGAGGVGLGGLEEHAASQAAAASLLSLLNTTAFLAGAPRIP
jgi:hypothetical protein